jgi:nicotinamidase-related amidase
LKCPLFLPVLNIHSTNECFFKYRLNFPFDKRIIKHRTFVLILEGEIFLQATALLIIDVQNRMFQRGASVYHDAKLLYNLKKLIASAKSKHMPIFYLQHESKGLDLKRHSENWKLHPFLTVEKDDLVIQKTTPDSFYETTLEKQLHDKGIKNLFIAGIQTEVCIDTTCRSAHSKGFFTHLIEDAHSTWDTPILKASQMIQHHNHTLQWFANTISTDQFVDRLR